METTWTSPETPARPAAREDPISVLFIEDDPSVAEMYRIKLEVDGYHVTVIDADDLRDNQVPRTRPELIFLDIRTPHRDRARLLRTLRTKGATRGLPVVILSDYNKEELTDSGIELESGEYLVVNFTAPSSLSPTLEAWARMEEMD